jgi:hypothetical protein
MYSGDMALVSIIVPCYRQAHYLAGAINSALAQTHPAVEVVVINDGSDDQTDSVSGGYAGRIRYVSKANGGLSSARNAGLKSAKGEYVLFLDADDLLHPEAVAWQLGAMAGANRRLCIMGWREFSDRPDEAGAVDRPAPDVKELLPTLFARNLAPVHSYLCSRQAIMAAGGFDESLRSHEDWDLWIRVAMAGADVRYLPGIGAYYRRYAGSMSTHAVRMRDTRAEVTLRAARRVAETPAALTRYGWPVALAVRDRLTEYPDARPETRRPERPVLALLAGLAALTRAVVRQRGATAPVDSDVLPHLLGAAYLASKWGRARDAYDLLDACGYLGAPRWGMLKSKAKIIPHKVLSVVRP